MPGCIEGPRKPCIVSGCHARLLGCYLRLSADAVLGVILQYVPGCHACCLDAMNVVSSLDTVNVNRIPGMVSCMVGECRPDA